MIISVSSKVCTVSFGAYNKEIAVIVQSLHRAISMIVLCNDIIIREHDRRKKTRNTRAGFLFSRAPLHMKHDNNKIEQ